MVCFPQSVAFHFRVRHIKPLTESSALLCPNFVRTIDRLF
jgi:hypothetical protein